MRTRTGLLCCWILHGLLLVDCQSQYHLVHLKLSWEDARQYCRENYTNLATLQTPDDVDRLPVPPGGWVWIGLFDDPASWMQMTSESNSWRWSSTGTTSPGQYQNWASDQPNNYGANEQCVYFKDGQWGDNSCDTTLYFVCYTVQPSGVKEYILITSSSTWSDSQSYCRQNYQDLATIQTSAENQEVTGILISTGYTVWIGLYRIPWRWSNGSPSTFRWWYPGEPNNSDLEFCTLQDEFGWNDLICGHPGYFVCHKDIITSSIKTKIKLQTAADLSDPDVQSTLLKELGGHLGFSARWSIPPTKEKSLSKTELTRHRDCPFVQTKQV